MWSEREEEGGVLFFFSSRRRHTMLRRDWSSDVCSSDLHCIISIKNQVWQRFTILEAVVLATALCLRPSRCVRKFQGTPFHGAMKTKTVSATIYGGSVMSAGLMLTTLTGITNIIWKKLCGKYMKDCATG